MVCRAATAVIKRTRRQKSSRLHKNTRDGIYSYTRRNRSRVRRAAFVQSQRLTCLSGVYHVVPSIFAPPKQSNGWRAIALSDRALELGLESQHKASCRGQKIIENIKPSRYLIVHAAEYKNTRDFLQKPRQTAPISGLADAHDVLGS